MAPSRASTSQASNINTVYTLSLLSEYNHTLDSLPLDLSRNFADLRELDAVLSSSMASIIMKIRGLTKVIEDRSSSKQERLILLANIADEAARLKLGGEDKIRVACQAADNLKGHIDHMRLLLGQIPSFDVSVLNRRTTYPHISSRSYMPIPENSRRKRGNYSSIMNSAPDVSPAKRKRNTRDDDIDITGGKSPRKDNKLGDTAPSRARNGARSRKPDRAPSPAESVLSVMSHIPPSASQLHAATSRASAHPGRGGNTANKRSKTQATSQPYDDPPNGATARRDAFPGPSAASTSHPSLPLPYSNGANGLHNYDITNGHAMANDWSGPLPHGQLEGPGMPVTRNALPMGPVSVITPIIPMGPANNHLASAAADTATEVGEGEGECDDQTYCFCDGVSYGEMIACDDSDCEREWFHLNCIGLASVPDGSWFCDVCRAKQKNAKRAARGGRKRVGGGARSGAKAANNS
ncbi:hypothetical protein JVT61DRAFT_5156 [Boletus reticuloceps]|uniref:Chromatin modification-related protein n=1 Tax=Boletus reticuloceps TaxID=495285 RepID=A0A8I2Z005_9AGAM|nr:hypothetical protein JVT61DRAFT_5156 [Boletus reticuloceps]